jgi:hypothetical protein
MNFEEFEHIIRAAANICNEKEFIVIGSQAILASKPDIPRELRNFNGVRPLPEKFSRQSGRIKRYWSIFSVLSNVSYFVAQNSSSIEASARVASSGARSSRRANTQTNSGSATKPETAQNPASALRHSHPPPPPGP